MYSEVVRRQLEQIGFFEAEQVDYNTISCSMNVAERVIATDVVCIVAMGGGKVLDVCKYAAYITKTPLLSIPPTAANDGIVSFIAVLKRRDDRPRSIGCSIPSMVLIDLDIILASPSHLIRAGIDDTISNYMALKDWRIACQRGKDKMNEYSYLISQSALDVLLHSQFKSISPEFIRVLVNSVILSDIAKDLAGSSRPVSESEHLFSHALDYYSPRKNSYGIQVALGTIAILRLSGQDASDVLQYLQQFDVDINPAHLDIEEDVLYTVCSMQLKCVRIATRC